MAVLSNWRHELYARNLVEVQLGGYAKKDLAKARTEAYKDAGFAPNTDNARRDANNPVIKARVAQLFAEAVEYRDVRAAAVVNRIDRIGRANLADFFDVVSDDSGHHYVLRNLKELPRELTAALSAIEWDDDGRPKIKLHDANQANFTLLKHFGGLPADDKADTVNNTLNIFAGLSVDDQRALAEALEALPAGPPSPDSKAA
jgi:hypothetical protein